MSAKDIVGNVALIVFFAAFLVAFHHHVHHMELITKIEEICNAMP